jgi:predicted metal-binding protein
MFFNSCTIMKLHTLFVCKSCSAIIDHEEADERAEGNQLLLQLLEAQKNDLTDCNLNIEAVGCLWRCDTPCSVTFTCQGKYTYPNGEFTRSKYCSRPVSIQ